MSTGNPYSRDVSRLKPLKSGVDYGINRSLSSVDPDNSIMANVDTVKYSPKFIEQQFYNEMERAISFDHKNELNDNGKKKKRNLNMTQVDFQIKKAHFYNDPKIT